MVKYWSTSQSVVALSSGEAELYALNKCRASALGLQSLLGEMGVPMSLQALCHCVIHQLAERLYIEQVLADVDTSM